MSNVENQPPVTLYSTKFAASLYDVKPGWNYVTAVQFLMNTNSDPADVPEVLSKLSKGDKWEYEQVLTVGFASPNINSQVMDAVIKYATTHTPSVLTEDVLQYGLHNTAITPESIHHILLFILNQGKTKQHLAAGRKPLQPRTWFSKIARHTKTSEETYTLIYKHTPYKTDLLKIGRVPSSIIDRFFNEWDVPNRELPNLLKHPNAKTETIAKYYRENHTKEIRDVLQTHKKWVEILQKTITPLMDDVNLTGMPVEWLELTDETLLGLPKTRRQPW